MSAFLLFIIDFLMLTDLGSTQNCYVVYTIRQVNLTGRYEEVELPAGGAISRQFDKIHELYKHVDNAPSPSYLIFWRPDTTRHETYRVSIATDISQGRPLMVHYNGRCDKLREVILDSPKLLATYYADGEPSNDAIRMQSPSMSHALSSSNTNCKLIKNKTATKGPLFWQKFAPPRDTRINVEKPQASPCLPGNATTEGNGKKKRTLSFFNSSNQSCMFHSK